MDAVTEGDEPQQDEHLVEAVPLEEMLIDACESGSGPQPPRAASHILKLSDRLSTCLCTVGSSGASGASLCLRLSLARTFPVPLLEHRWATFMSFMFHTVCVRPSRHVFSRHRDRATMAQVLRDGAKANCQNTTLRKIPPPRSGHARIPARAACAYS